MAYHLEVSILLHASFERSICSSYVSVTELRWVKSCEMAHNVVESPYLFLRHIKSHFIVVHQFISWFCNVLTG